MRLLLAMLLLLIAAPAWAQQGQGMSQAMVVSSCSGGGATLPPGGLNQLTMDTTGRLCQSGIGSGVCAEASAYLARTAGGNEGGNDTNIKVLICGLVSDGVWAGLDALYVLAQQNSTDAKLNLVGTSYGLTNVSSVPFTIYRGYGSFASVGGYLNTGFNPATATSPKFTQNSASFGDWAVVGVVETVPEMGTASVGNSGETHVYNYYSGTTFYARLNNGTTGGVASPAATGLFIGDRPSSTTVIPYYNGTAQASQASTSQAPFSASFLIGTTNTAAFSSFYSGDTIAAAVIGASLGDAGQTALYNRLRTYMTAVGAP